MESVSTGSEERARADSERKSKQERIEAEKQKKREEDTAFWTTPGLRPLAEPPIVDWEWFVRTCIPSDLGYKALFTGDPWKRCRMKDVDGEMEVLFEYTKFAGFMRDDPETDHFRREFYKNLHDDPHEDWQKVHKEYCEIYFMATRLSRFEFMELDNDGRTTKLEQWIEKGADDQR